MIVLYILLVAVGLLLIWFGIEKYKIFIIFLGMCIIIIGLAKIFERTDKNKKEIPVTIYTSRDIYYIYEDSIKSESGKTEVHGDFKKAYIELLTAQDAQIDSTWNQK